MAWELIIAVVVLGGIMIAMLVRTARAAGGARSENKARKIQQAKAEASDEIRTSPLRRGGDLLKRMRGSRKR